MRLHRRAFTLIELMVVVAIFAVVAAVLLPAMLRVREKGSARATATQAVAAPSPPPGVAPDIRSLRADLTLRTAAQRQGMEVVNRYELLYEANLELERSPHTAAEQPLLLSLPFPQDAQTRDVRLQLTQGQRQWEPEDLQVTGEGVRWSGALTQGQTLQARLSFVSSGQSRLALPLPVANRLENVHLTLHMTGGAVPSLSSLQPSQQSPELVSWDYTNLASPKPIVVDLPATESQTARVLLLCRLVGLAVMLFGLGFWYVGELHSPGRLQTFRWGQFFLLALTYSFFFPVLAVLTLNTGLPLLPGMAWAAGLSLPLLMLHVSRIVNLRFAVFYTLPLAALTLGLVVNGVFGGPYRELVYLGAGFLTISFLTLSYRRWYQHRCQAQLQLEGDLERRLARIGEQARLGREEAANAHEASSDSEMKQRVFQQRQRLLEQVYEAESLAQELAELPSIQPFSRRCELRAQMENRCANVERLLPLARREVNLATHHACEAQARTRHRLNAAPGDVYCVSCGQPGPDSPCCPQCGHRRPRRLECACGCQLMLPPEGSLGAFCPGCGERRAELEG